MYFGVSRVHRKAGDEFPEAGTEAAIQHKKWPDDGRSEGARQRWSEFLLSGRQQPL